MLSIQYESVEFLFTARDVLSDFPVASTPVLEMSANDFFNRIPSHSQWFIPIPIRNPRFSLVLFPFPSHSHRLYHTRYPL